MVKRRRMTAVAISAVAVLTLLGVSIFVHSRAASPFLAAEAEQGTISGPAVQTTDGTASGGSAVTFGDALGCVDKPSAPTNYKAAVTARPSIEMTWTASKAVGNCRLAGYRFWRADGPTAPPASGTPYADDLAAPSYSNTNVSFNKTYSYTLVAYDTVGHVSDPVTLTVKTPVASDWAWPVHAEDLGSQTVGLAQCWLHYYQPRDSYHAGLDIRVTYKPVYAPHDGKVVGKYSDGYNTLIIDTGMNAATGKTLYAVFEHMSAITISNGDTVNKGQRIGTSGEVGAPGAPHLHFGISDSASLFGTYANPWHTANPIDFLPNDYSPALLTVGSYSCETSSIKTRSDHGLSAYKTKGSFSMYK